MMRVIVEIHPGGDSSAKREIARLDIANVSELALVSDYRVEAKLDEPNAYTLDVRGHHRSHGWMPLLRRILDQLERASLIRRYAVRSPSSGDDT